MTEDVKELLEDLNILEFQSAVDINDTARKAIFIIKALSARVDTLEAHQDTNINMMAEFRERLATRIVAMGLSDISKTPPKT